MPQLVGVKIRKCFVTVYLSNSHQNIWKRTENLQKCLIPIQSSNQSLIKSFPQIVHHIQMIHPITFYLHAKN